MSENDWNNAAAYAYMNNHDAEGFGCEFLHRNENFHKEFTASSADGEVTDAFAAKWGLRFRTPNRSGEGNRVLDLRRLSPRSQPHTDEQDTLG